MGRFLFAIILLTMVVYGKPLSGQLFYSSKPVSKDSLLNVLPNIKGAERVKTLAKLSACYHLSDSSRSLSYAREALTLAEKLNRKELVLAGTNAVALAYHHGGNYPRSVSYGLDAFEMALELGDSSLILQTITYLGLGYLYSGNQDLALKIALNGHMLLPVWKDPPRQFDLHIRMGWIYMAIGQFRNAIPYFRKADSIATSSSVIPTPNVALNLGHLGTCYMSLNIYDSALNVLRRAMILKLSSTPTSKMNGYIDLGDCFNKMGIADSAEYYYQKAKNEQTDCFDYSVDGWTNLPLGEIYASKKQWSKARSCYKQAIRSGQWILQNRLSNSCFSETVDSWYTPEQHVPFYLESIGLGLTSNGYNKLYELYKTIGKSDSALYCLEQFNIVKKKQDELRKRSEVMEFSTRYESERKEQKIQLLSQKQEITALRLSQTRFFLLVLIILVILLVLLGVLLFRQNKLRNEQQTDLLSQKLFRVQMNPHFIYNSLSSIQGFILQKDHINASIYLSRFAKLVRNILDSSLEEMIPLAREIQTIENYLQLQKVRYEEQFDFIIEVDDAIEGNELMIPPMLVQPFVENSIEHGIKHKKGKGRIKVLFKMEGSDLLIKVEDDGVGRKRSAELEMEQNKYHASLSTTLINERLRFLNKKSSRKIKLNITDLFTETGEACGTRVLISIPF